MTPKRLREHLGLTSGAVTACVDRLERFEAAAPGRGLPGPVDQGAAGASSRGARLSKCHSRV